MGHHISGGGYPQAGYGRLESDRRREDGPRFGFDGAWIDSLAAFVPRAYLPRISESRIPNPYSYRSASIGSSREALNAGYMPKKRPTDAENPRPIANDHQGSEMGKPVKK